MNGDLRTDGRDLSTLLSNFGESAPSVDPDPNQTLFDEWLIEMGFEPGPHLQYIRGDLNFDGTVDGLDLSILLNNFQCSEV